MEPPRELLLGDAVNDQRVGSCTPRGQCHTVQLYKVSGTQALLGGQTPVLLSRV